MRIYDLLSSDSRRNVSKLFGGINLHSDNRTASKRNSERLTEREIKSLMGTNRDRYYKRNGRVKRK